MTKHFDPAFKRSEGRCTYCAKDLSSDFDAFYSAQEDHLVPRAADGRDEAENIVIACFVCNNLRGKYIPPDHSSMTRAALIEAIRAHIFARRAEQMGTFLGWVASRHADASK